MTKAEVLSKLTEAISLLTEIEETFSKVYKYRTGSFYLLEDAKALHFVIENTQNWDHE